MSDRFAPPPSVFGLSRNVVIAGGVVLFHAAALWALQSGLLRRAVEVVIPVEMISELIDAPKPAQPPPPPPPPPQPKVVKSPPPPRPQAIREPRPTPAPNAPTGSVEPPPPPAPPAPPAPPEPPAPPPPAPPAPALVEISEGQTRYIREPKVVFPAMSRRLGESGTVIVSVYYSSSGIPKRAEIFKSSGYDRLDQAARDAAMSSQVTPIKQPGANDATVYLLKAPIKFVLSQ